MVRRLTASIALVTLFMVGRAAGQSIRFSAGSEKPEPVRIVSDGGEPLPGDIVFVEGFAITLDSIGLEGVERAEWSRDALIRKEADGTERVIAVIVRAGQEELEEASAFQRLTKEQVSRLLGVDIHDWNASVAEKLAALNPVAIAQVDVYSAGGNRAALGGLPATLTRITMRNGSGTLDDLERFEKLEALTIRASGRCVLPPAALRKKKALRMLRLAGVEGMRWGALGDAEELRSLDLIAVKGLTNLDFVATLPNLRSLRVAMSAATDMRPLAKAKSLREVWLFRNPIKHMPGKSSALTRLEAIACGVTENQAAAFRAANPACSLALSSVDVLRVATAGATRLRVRSGGTCHRDEAEERTLFELEDKDTIAALIAEIAVDDAASGGDCQCCGEPTLEFFRGDSMIAMVGFHHGQSLRWSGWSGDAALTRDSAQRITEFLGEHGVQEPGEDLRQRESSAREWKARWERYQELLPPGLDEVMRSRKPESDPMALFVAKCGGEAQAATLCFRLAGRHLSEWAFADPFEEFALGRALDAASAAGRDAGAIAAQADEYGVRGLARWLFHELGWKALGRPALDNVLERAASAGLSHPDPAARRETIDALMRIGGDPAIRILRRIMAGEFQPGLPATLESFKGGPVRVVGTESAIGRAERDSTAAAHALASLKDRASLGPIRGLLLTATKGDVPTLEAAVGSLETEH